mmetsp:Transcript_116840/g.203293  ORF Transcript_116840/g.203293 Transcript_116840/m.203293 type:complete len:102 (-) Transcript_116840:826-1131(-)
MPINTLKRLFSEFIDTKRLQKYCVTSCPVSRHHCRTGWLDTIFSLLFCNMVTAHPTTSSSIVFCCFPLYYETVALPSDLFYLRDCRLLITHSFLPHSSTVV